MAIVLVRHTRPKISEGVCYGRRDVPLPSEFEAEAKLVVDGIAAVDRLITSPLTRCHRLAQKIGAAFGKTPEVDQRVQEMDFGTWEGRRWSEIPRQELDAWSLDFLQARPHGGENIAQFRERARLAVDEYAAAHEASTNCVIVTHAGVIKALLAEGDAAEDFNIPVQFGEIVAMPATTE